MKGFLLGALGLTFAYALLQGQSSGRGGNVTGLLGVPGAVVRKILDPNDPFFRRPATAAGSAAPAATPGVPTTPGPVWT